MKKLLFSIICSLLIMSGYAQNFWTQKSNFGGVARYRAMGCAIGDKGYFLMGACDGVPSTTDFWEYNPTNNTWTQKADFPGIARGGGVMAAFEINGKGYFGLGAHWAGGAGNYTCYNDFWEYNPLTNSWTQKANFPGVSRHCLVTFEIDGLGYIMSGVDGSDVYYNDMWEYNPVGNSWAQKASVGTTGRAWGIGFSINKKGYFGLGQTSTGTRLTDFWEYDQSSNTWTQKADYPGSGRIMASGFAIGGQGYAGFGSNGSSIFKDFWMYTPASNSWTQKSDLTGSARYFAGSFVVGGKAYVGTGYSSWYLDDLWEYTPDGYGINTNANINIQYQWLNSTSQLTVTAPAITSLAVYDINGRLLTSRSYAHQDEIQTDLSLLSSGVYIFQVITNGTAVAKKIVKN